jgi:hypothetical protein
MRHIFEDEGSELGARGSHQSSNALLLAEALFEAL